MTLTTGGLLTGTCLLASYLTYWWYRERTPGNLGWFAATAAYGILAMLATGSLLAYTGSAFLWGSNGLGDITLVYGVGGTTGDVTRAASSVVLNGGGRFAVAVITVVLIFRIKFKPTGRIKVVAGVLCGICFALSATVAGAAAVPLASAVNTIGVAWTQVTR